MPAAQSHDWSEVRATAIALGSIAKAARHHNVTYNAAKLRASREQWPVGFRPKKLAQKATEALKQHTQRANPNADTVDTGSALESELKEGKSLYLQRMNSVVLKASKAAEELQPDQALKMTRNIKELMDSGHKLHQIGESQNGGAVINLNILSMGAESFVDAQVISPGMEIAND